MNSYGYVFKNLSSSSEFVSLVSSGQRSFHFRYKNFDFYYLHRSRSLNTLVSFHAAVSPSIDLPVFRGHNWNIDNANILCVSDYTLARYRDFNKSKIPFDATFFQPTKNINTEKVLTDVIRFVVDYNSGDSIMFGTSAGGLAALKYSCYFDSVALIGNAEFFLESWWNFPNTANIIKQQNDEIFYPDIFQWIKEFGPPKRLVLSSNVFDEMTYDKHHAPLISFFKNFYPDKIFEIRHCEKHTGKFHTSHFPENTPHKGLIKNLLYKSKEVVISTYFPNRVLDDFSHYRKFLKVIDLNNLSSLHDDDLISFNYMSSLLVLYGEEKESPLSDLPLKFDWVFRKKDVVNLTPSKHGVFTISLPFKDFVIKTNSFRIEKNS